VLEVQREASLAAAAGLDPTLVRGDDAQDSAGETDAVSPGVASAAVAAATAATAAALAADELRKAQALEHAVEEPVGEDAAAGEASAPSAPVPSQTQAMPVIDQIEVAELGLADRLGLGETDPDDEVGPTS
jgi:cell division transport system ATP-binding protein